LHAPSSTDKLFFTKFKTKVKHNQLKLYTSQLVELQLLQLLLCAQLLSVNDGAQLCHAVVQLALPVDHHVVKLVNMLRLIPAAAAAAAADRET
jgi:hypothetical protein